MLNASINPDEVDLIEGFTKDMSSVGHWGTGNLQIIIKTMEDFEAAKPLLDKAYEEN